VPIGKIGPWFRAMASDRFYRSVGILVGGTAAAHAITTAALLVVTRLYSPDDFAVLAFLTATCSIISGAACLRFDVAIPVLEDDREAVNCLALALLFSAAIAIVLAVFAIATPDWVARLARKPEYVSYLWLVPIIVFNMGAYSSLQYWFVRRRRFSSVASNRIWQASTSAITQIVLGLAHFAPLGLLLGALVNWIAGGLGLGARYLRQDSATLSAISKPLMLKVFSDLKRFPLFSAPEALLNSASIYVPIVLISMLAIGPEAGYIILAMQVMQAPMALVGSAVSNVYISDAAAHLRANTLSEFTGKIFGRLLRTGIGPLVFAGFIAPATFGFIFGPQWLRAGELVSWMTPWFILQFLASPLSTSLLVTSSQVAAVLLQLFGFLLRVGAVLAAHFIAPAYLGEAYAVSGLVFYATYLAVVLAITMDGARPLRAETFRAVPILIYWSVAGLAANIVLQRLFDSGG
jgi:O-antigen/teichoic acid export membrane protein